MYFFLFFITCILCVCQCHSLVNKVVCDDGVKHGVVVIHSELCPTVELQINRVNTEINTEMINCD